MRALDTAQKRGATYADARYVSTETQTITVKNDVVESVTSHSDRGVGVRVIANGAWGFASTGNMQTREMDIVAANAVRIARASSSVLRNPVDIGEPFSIVDTYRTPILKDPFQIPVEHKVALLLNASAEMQRSNPAVKVAEAGIEIIKTTKI